MKTKVVFKIHPDWERWSGFCRIVYISKNDKNQKILYCLQDDGSRFGGVKLYRCSLDGEPSYEIKLKPNSGFEFEKPTGESGLEKLVKIWIEENNK